MTRGSAESTETHQIWWRQHVCDCSRSCKFKPQILRAKIESSSKGKKRLYLDMNIRSMSIVNYVIDDLQLYLSLKLYNIWKLVHHVIIYGKFESLVYQRLLMSFLLFLASNNLKWIFQLKLYWICYWLLSYN